MEVTFLPSVVNGWQAGPVLSPGYVRRSEDRLCEPHFQRSTALSGVRVDVQDYLGAGIVPTPQPRLKLTLNTLRANPTPFLELSL